MNRRSALRAGALPVHIARQGRRAIETSGRDYVLKQPGKARSRDINGWAGTVGLGAIFPARTSGIALGILVPALSILTVIVHLLFRLLKSALLHYANASIRRSSNTSETRVNQLDQSEDLLREPAKETSTTS